MFNIVIILVNKQKTIIQVVHLTCDHLRKSLSDLHVTYTEENNNIRMLMN